jgi:ATP-dependent helicase/nuclease subunit A
MVTELPGDEQARERIRTDLDSTLLVEASAGTGKTSVLVDRVVSLVLNGTSVEKIAAITFTEKAATELRDRVRAGLEDAAAETPEAVALKDAALESLERAQLSTIHSFCQSLLRGLAPRAEIDPSFVISDEVKAERRQQERWRLFLDELAQDEGGARVVQRLLGLGMFPGDLEKLVKHLEERAELVTLLEARPIKVPTPMWPNLDEMERGLVDLGVERQRADDKLRTAVERAISLVHDLKGAAPRDREIILASSTGTLSLSFRDGRREEWGARIVDVRETAKAACGRLAEVLQVCRQEALAAFLPILVRFVKQEARARGREGELTFGDLILRTRDLLLDDKEAVRSLRERFDVLLIDEFQDTDPLQVDIALAFGRDPDTGKLEPGRLFLVGDPKQSIYRFRRADMGMYSQTRERVEDEDGDFPVLSKNRRSRPEIVEWVNGVFATLIGAGENRTVQPPYLAMSPERGETLKGPGVAHFGGESELKAAQVRQLESDDAAALCRTVKEEGWEVWDRASAEVRRADYKDIALLMPTRAGLIGLEKSLVNAGVPYRVEGGSLVYRTQEVRDLINCLAAINDPADEVAVVAALRSPAFACTDVQLALHKVDGGYFNYDRSTEKGEPKVLESLATLADYHQRRHASSLAALVERFVADRGLVETGILDRGDRNSFRRMRFVVEQARLFEESGPESLREFVTWLENRGARDFLDNEGAGLDDDEDAVRILTVHGAKGLEFPIVILVGMSTAPANRSGCFLADWTTGDVAVKGGTDTRRFTVGPYDRLNTVEREHGAAEFGRILYVATTRARDHLIFSLHRRVNDSACGAGRLEAAGAAERAVQVTPVQITHQSVRSPLDGLEVDVPEQATSGEFEAARLELVNSRRTKLYTSATAEVREMAASGSEKTDENDEGEPWARGRGGTRLGRAVHAAIQSLPLDADATLVEAFARAQAVAEAIPHRAADVARLVRRALASEAAGRARQAQRALREVPFAVKVGDVTLEGFIDMLVQTDEGLEVVDWKTDQIPADEVEARMSAYRLQAGLYAWGVREATGMDVQRVTYVFANAGREVTPGEPADLEEEARKHLATRGASVSSP